MTAAPATTVAVIRAHRRTPLPRLAGRVLLRLVVAAGALVFVSVLVYAVLSALKPAQEITQVPMRWLPTQWQWGNVLRPFTETAFGTYLRNSLVVGASVTLLNVVTCTLAGFGFARYRFLGRDGLFLVVLATLMIPVEIIYVPLYALIYDLGWSNSWAALIVPAGTSAFGIFLMRQAAGNIPEELVEAARLDGAGELRLLRHIGVPLMAGSMAVLAVFIFITNWDSHLWPLLVATDDAHRTLPVGLATMQAGSVGNAGLPMILAAAVLAILPTVALFLALQRKFVEGVSATAGLK
jgi:multiple sugar transport system permease protein